MRLRESNVDGYVLVSKAQTSVGPNYALIHDIIVNCYRGIVDQRCELFQYCNSIN